MFSMAGEVIGIVSHNISKSGGSEGLGFVVTINTAKQFLLEKHSFGGQAYTVGGDIILKIEGIAVGDVRDLVKIREHLGTLPSGKAYTITVLRAGRVLDLTGHVP